MPVLRARYFDEEVVGASMLDRLGHEIFGELDPAALLHTELAQEIEQGAEGVTRMRIRVPFAERSEISLKKVGSELVVAAGREKRTIILPPALARRSPSGAKLEDGSLEVSFSYDGHPSSEPERSENRSAEPV